jgi:hypothetical protein
MTSDSIPIILDLFLTTVLLSFPPEWYKRIVVATLAQSKLAEVLE